MEAVINWYEHHIKDYDSATMHLSWEEDLAYTRLLRWYYRKEEPIPGDLEQACRIVRAATDLQRQAVEQVLREFFQKGPDGCWHKDSCDRAIAAYQAGQPERDAKKANEATRLQRHREERAALFRQLTAAGVHLPWNARIDTVREAVEKLAATPPATRAPAASPSVNAPATRPATASATPATATHYPLPTTHYPPTRVRGGAGGDPAPARGSRRCPPDWSPSEDLMAWARAERLDIDVEAELATMRDHQFATARSDWSATFRNWIRRASPAGARAAPGAPRETPLARERREQYEAMTGGLASAKRPTTTAKPPAAPPPGKEFDDEHPHLPAPTRRLG